MFNLASSLLDMFLVLRRLYETNYTLAGNILVQNTPLPSHPTGPLQFKPKAPKTMSLQELSNDTVAKQWLQ